MGFTVDDILNSACGPLNQHLKGDGSKSTKASKNVTSKKEAGAKNKEWIQLQLKAWCEGMGYLLIREHTFSEERGWRFDWAVFKGTEKLVAIEYEGIFSKKSRHTTKAGYSEDSNKYREASLQGWKVLRYTAKNYETLNDDLLKL